MVLRDSGERVVPEWIGPADRMGFMLLEQHRQRYEIASSDIRGKRVLDLGCGAGYGAHSMADSGAERVTAVDVDSAALAYAFDNYSHPAIEYIQHDATTFTPDPGAYDLVCHELGPGDLTVHHARTLHAAGGNRSERRRRAISIRYCGDDARFRLRPGTVRKDHHGDLAEGDPLGGLDVPQVWPRATA